MHAVKAFLLFGFLIFQSTSADAQQTPKYAVSKLYSLYGIGSATLATGLDERNAYQVLTKRLAKLYKRAVNSGGMSFDFLVQGQDFDIVKPIEITRTQVTGNRATISAVLTQRDFSGGRVVEAPKRFTYIAVREREGWRIDEALYKGEKFSDSLRADIRFGRSHR